MAIVWIIVELLFIFLCFRLPQLEQDGETQNSKSYTSNHNTAIIQSTNGDTTISKDEVSPLLHTETVSSRINGVAYGSTSPTQRMSSLTINHSVSVAETNLLMQPAVREKRGCSALVGRFRKHCLYLLSEMIREEIIVLLALLLVTMFNLATFEVRL